MPQLIQKGQRGWDRTIGNSARVSCRKCGHNNFIPGSEIYPDGLVREQYNCLKPGCGWQDFIILEGWSW